MKDNPPHWILLVNLNFQSYIRFMKIEIIRYDALNDPKDLGL